MEHMVVLQLNRLRDRNTRKLKTLAQRRGLSFDGLGRGTFYGVLKMGWEKRNRGGELPVSGVENRLSSETSGV